MKTFKCFCSGGEQIEYEEGKTYCSFCKNYMKKVGDNYVIEDKLDIIIEILKSWKK